MLRFINGNVIIKDNLLVMHVSIIVNNGNININTFFYLILLMGSIC